MVSADGLIRDSKRTIQYLHFTESERPFGIQIFGSDPFTIAKAAEFSLRFNPDFIDLNMGCPVKKVVKRNAGSALMKTPELAALIVKETKKALGDTIPLTVKFRSGWDNNSLNYIQFGLLMQDSGADAVCLHARTTKQMFSGVSNWSHIKLLKEALQIPVIGNGDIKDPESAHKMFSETACDSIMIGRGALGKPWLFEQIKQSLCPMSDSDYSSLTHQRWKDTVLRHLQYSLETKRESVVIKEIRSHICFYTKGLVGGAELRRKINNTDSVDQLISLLQNPHLSLA